MSIGAIRDALEARLATLTDLPEVGWENVHFDPPDGEVHLLCYLLRGQTARPTMGGSEMTREVGVLQVSGRGPLNKGSRPIEAVLDAVREHFPAGLSLTSGGVTVTIERRGSVTPARQDGAWHRIDLSIPYFANVFHPT